MSASLSQQRVTCKFIYKRKIKNGELDGGKTEKNVGRESQCSHSNTYLSKSKSYET